MLRDQMITKGISTHFCNKLARKFLVKGKNKLIINNLYIVEEHHDHQY